MFNWLPHEIKAYLIENSCLQIPRRNIAGYIELKYFHTGTKGHLLLRIPNKQSHTQLVGWTDTVSTSCLKPGWLLRPHKTNLNVFLLDSLLSRKIVSLLLFLFCFKTETERKASCCTSWLHFKPDKTIWGNAKTIPQTKMTIPINSVSTNFPTLISSAMFSSLFAISRYNWLHFFLHFPVNLLGFFFSSSDCWQGKAWSFHWIDSLTIHDSLSSSLCYKSNTEEEILGKDPFHWQKT